MQILDLWIYIVKGLCGANFIIILFSILAIVSVFGLIDHRLR